MKQHTPEEEAKLVSDSSETFNFKFISNKIKAYKQFKVDDIIIDESSKVKYKITYIELGLGLIYGRRVCLSGALGKNLHHITGMYSTFILDADQISAILLDGTYDPMAKEKAISKRKREVYTQRAKQRHKMSRDGEKTRLWCVEHLSEDQTIWITSDSFMDRKADKHEYAISSFGATGVHVVDRDGHPGFVGFDVMYQYNIYTSKPIVYKEIP